MPRPGELTLAWPPLLVKHRNLDHTIQQMTAKGTAVMKWYHALAGIAIKVHLPFLDTL